MEWIRQLQDAVDYMEAHLLENVNYEDAARSVFLSAYSFHGFTGNFSRRQGIGRQSLRILSFTERNLSREYSVSFGSR